MAPSSSSSKPNKSSAWVPLSQEEYHEHGRPGRTEASIRKRNKNVVICKASSATPAFLGYRAFSLCPSSWNPPTDPNGKLPPHVIPISQIKAQGQSLLHSPQNLHLNLGPLLIWCCLRCTDPEEKRWQDPGGLKRLSHRNQMPTTKENASAHNSFSRSAFCWGGSWGSHPIGSAFCPPCTTFRVGSW